MITIRSAGDAALLVDLKPEVSDGSGQDGNEAARLAAAITAAALTGVTDIVPGAATVLVRFAPGVRQSADLASQLRQLAAGPLPDLAGPADPVIVFSAVYDGPDLAAVASLTGLPVDEVIARHQAAEYRVGWLGFSPGFGYLTGLDPLLAAVPRLDSPRQFVPAGSVAIAGGLAAVYPAASPGGWRLLGRTDAVLWDPDRQPPSLLAPGRRVRFRAVRPEAALTEAALTEAALTEAAPAEAAPAEPAPAEAAQTRGAPDPGAPGPGARDPGARDPGARGPGARGPAAPSLGARDPGARGPAAPSPGGRGPGARGPGAPAPAAASQRSAAAPAAMPAQSVDAPGGRLVQILQPGPLTTIQDLGRPGFAHLGVPRSGAADQRSLRQANRLAGNDDDAACLEVTLGRLALRFDFDAIVALTGAPAPIRLSAASEGTSDNSAAGSGDGKRPGRQPAFEQPASEQPASEQPASEQPALGQPALGQPVLGQPVLGQPAFRQPALRRAEFGPAEFGPAEFGAAFAVPAGTVLRLGSPPAGLRSYLAIAGGIDVPAVLGSRSADLLSGLGPRALRQGEWLSVGRPRSRSEKPGQLRPDSGEAAGADAAAAPVPAESAVLRAIAGPRDDWFAAAVAELAGGSYQVSPASNRTGLRLTGPALRRVRITELPSEGVAAGSLQVSHDGQPILLLADHPTTGGYPVIAVVVSADLSLAAQLRPGQQLRFEVSPPPVL